MTLARRGSSAIKRVLLEWGEHLFGTRIQEARWRAKDMIEPEETLTAPRRHHLVEQILSHEPTSVLEVGCNTGVTLRLLQAIAPSVRVAGIDINGRSIERGRQLSPDLDLRVGSVRRLPYADGEFDVVYTDACLMYIGDDAIRVAIAELRRVAGIAVVAREWWTLGVSRREGASWLHDYAALGADLRPAFPQSPEWERWGRVAHFPPARPR